jgi:hypothetical protein
MGSRRDANIEAMQALIGIKPATGHTRELSSRPHNSRRSWRDKYTLIGPFQPSSDGIYPIISLAKAFVPDGGAAASDLKSTSFFQLF